MPLQIFLLEWAEKLDDVALQLRECVKATRRAPTAFPGGDWSREHLRQLVLRNCRRGGDAPPARRIREVLLRFNDELWPVLVIEGEPLRRRLQRGREREHTEIRSPAFGGEHARGATVDEVRHIVGELE